MPPRLISNPPSPFERYSVEWLDVPPVAQLQVYEERCNSILSKNDSPDVGFNYSVNPYRGCFHACAYCYARPSHQYLQFGAGSDFERKIVAKINAPEKLHEAFMKRSWKGESLVFSGNTDCYQPLEATYELTRQCLEVCKKFRNPVGIITKGALIERDVELLAELHRIAGVKVYVSLAFIDDDVSKLIEPGAPRPSRRLRTVRVLADAGIPVSIALAPVIPGLNDHTIPELLIAAQKQGAKAAFMNIVRLPGEVREIFLERIVSTMPDRSKKIINAIKSMRDGQLNQSDFGQRMSGSGPRWDAVRWLFESTCKKLGFNPREGETEQRWQNTFRRPAPQLSLFD